MTVIAKSAGVLAAAMIVSVVAYVIWIWRKVPGMFSLDAGRLAYWPVLLGIILAGLILEYLHVSRGRSMLLGAVIFVKSVLVGIAAFLVSTVILRAFIVSTLTVWSAFDSWGGYASSEPFHGWVPVLFFVMGFSWYMFRELRFSTSRRGTRAE